MRADARFVLFPQFLERKFNDMSEEIEIKDEVLDLKVTETYESSTTIAMASSRADSVSRLMENPKIQRKRKVPIKATGTAIIGISVERKSCKKIYTTMNTSTKVMIKVKITSSIDANKNSVTSIRMTFFNPGG